MYTNIEGIVYLTFLSSAVDVVPLLLDEEPIQ